MKMIFIAIVGLLLCAGLIQAQNDYMYVMKGGAVIMKQSIKLADVDTIVYYEPAHSLTTTAVNSIASTTAYSGGTIGAYAGAVVSARGVCWSTAIHPTIALSTKTSNGTATGVFTSSITGLTASTLYYVRAYATNNSGVTAYGNELSFTTLVGVPVLAATTAASSITAFTASCGGNVTADGGAAVTARGVCWSTTTSPLVSGNHTTDASDTGSFTSSITGLTSATLYYVRAYATNSKGTSYGTQVSFMTAAVKTIGSTYLGGKIAYVDASGIHGFVCALADQSTGVKWHNGSLVATNATNTVLETTGVYGITKSGGRKNTDLIISGQGAGTYAASICATLTDGGATAGDWYLPSKDELNQVYLHKASFGIFAAFGYWTSSELNNGYAWFQFFDNGIQYYNNDKSTGYRVRAIRAF